MSHDFPKVLVVTPTRFNLKAGGGVTMGNLFRGWPKSHLAQVYATEFIPPDETVCDKYITGRFNLEKLKPLNEGVLNELLNSKHNKYFYSSSSINVDDIFNRIKSRFQPDIIYTDARDNPPYYLWLGRVLAEKFKIPYVLHIMDDWPNRFVKQHNSAIDRLFLKQVFEKEFNSLISNSKLNICISPEMAAEYKERYNKEFIPFHNTIDIDEWFQNEKYYSQDEETFSIVYIGAVTADKELYSLIDIKDAVIALNEEGINCQFQIYTADVWREPAEKHLTAGNVSGYAGFLDRADLPATLTASDLLVLPINFDEKSLEYIKLSIQTKVPEYMASGTPSLVYAPAASPNARYAREEGWGAVVSEINVDILKEKIKEIIFDEDLREKLGTRGREVVLQSHAASVVREKFKNSLKQALHE